MLRIANNSQNSGGTHHFCRLEVEPLGALQAALLLLV